MKMSNPSATTARPVRWTRTCFSPRQLVVTSSRENHWQTSPLSQNPDPSSPTASRARMACAACASYARSTRATTARRTRGGDGVGTAHQRVSARSTRARRSTSPPLVSMARDNPRLTTTRWRAVARFGTRLTRNRPPCSLLSCAFGRESDGLPALLV